MTIVINSFDHACLLDEAINGVLLHTYARLDVVVVAGRSTDDSSDSVACYLLSASTGGKAWRRTLLERISPTLEDGATYGS